jgi:hypothetical protein
VVAERDRIGAGIDELIVDDLGTKPPAAFSPLTTTIELPIGNERAAARSRWSARSGRQCRR